MTSSLSSLGDNPAGGLLKDKCKNCKSCLGYINVAYGFLVFKLAECKKL